MALLSHSSPRSAVWVVECIPTFSLLRFVTIKNIHAALDDLQLFVYMLCHGSFIHLKLSSILLDDFHSAMQNLW